MRVGTMDLSVPDDARQRRGREDGAPRAAGNRRRWWLLRLSLLVGALLVVLVVLEVGLRILGPSRTLPLFGTSETEFWERRFLKLYDDNEFVYGNGLHVHHPTRGWRPKPNTTVLYDGKRYSINELGQRSTQPYRPQPGRYGVLIVGDSFTFGIDADDEAVWPTILQSRDPALQVVNLGVGGYGLDQMLITLRETIGLYQPELVVVAFVDDDLRRAVLSFRDYSKPKFALTGAGLKLTNTPVPEPADMLRRLKAKYAGSDRSVLLSAVRRLIQSRSSRQTMLEVNRRIVSEMANVAAQAGARFLIVHLAYGTTIASPSAKEDMGEVFLRDFVKDHPIPSLFTGPVFRERGGTWAVNHYQKAEAEVVAEAVQRKIETLRESPRPQP
jgi:hypothetical protein